MRTRSVAFVLLLMFGMVALMSGSASAARPCVADLASSRRAGMAQVVSDWQDDFLGLEQPAGWYAVHIAFSRAPDCPS